MRRGFTLVELMVVVAIIGVLAKVAIPIYSHYMGRVAYQEAVMQLSTYKTFYQTLVLSQGYTAPEANGSYQVICAWTNSWTQNSQWNDPPWSTEGYDLDAGVVFYGDNDAEFCRNNRPPPPISRGIFSSTKFQNNLDDAEWDLDHVVDPTGQELILFFIAPAGGAPYGIKGGIYNPDNPGPFDTINIKGVVGVDRQITWRISPKSGCKLHEGGAIC